MDRTELREALYHRYLKPCRKKTHRYAGIEFELPVLNLDKEAVDFDILHRITDEFMEHFHFEPVGIDDEGHIFSAREQGTGDILSFDCSYNNLEFSFGRAYDLKEVEKRFKGYYHFWQEKLAEVHYTLTGMGVNPYRQYNHNVPIPTGRYRMLYHHLHSYTRYDLPMFFHSYPAYGTFSSASQVQLDIESQVDLFDTMKTFSRLEPMKAVLFSNSLLLDGDKDLLCVRDMFWENSTHGINPHNIGMYKCEIKDAEELLNYLEMTSLYCVERGDKYIHFTPTPLLSYFELDEMTGDYYDKEKDSWESITFQPQKEDLAYLRTFKFEDFTFRGTVEFRSVCCQPVRDCMTVAAFHVGLRENQKKLGRLLEEDQVIYHHGYTPAELRQLFVRRTLPKFVDIDALYKLIHQILLLSREGLEKRGLHEEVYLDPLFERVRLKTNPALSMLNRLEAGEELEDIILDYSVLE